MVTIDNTYAEAFRGIFARLVITAQDEKRLKRAAYTSTALPLTVLGESECGIEKWLSKDETPDGRIGAIIQVWVNYGKEAPARLEKELGKRIRQGILVVPTTRIFNACESGTYIDIMNKVGHCGDGYEWEENRYGRKVINIPIMMGEFLIERKLGYKEGVMGGNVWYFCKSMDDALKIGDKTMDSLSKVDGIITAFDICSAGSKPETNYPEIGPSTNHWFCPTLKSKIKGSLVPEGVGSIPEIVINGVDIDAVKEAMKVAIDSVRNMKGLVRISAGNYGGKLGPHKVYLKDIVEI